MRTGGPSWKMILIVVAAQLACVLPGSNLLPQSPIEKFEECYDEEQAQGDEAAVEFCLSRIPTEDQQTVRDFIEICITGGELWDCTLETYPDAAAIHTETALATLAAEATLEAAAAERTADLTLVSAVAVMDACEQEQQQHNFMIQCVYTIDVQVEYSAIVLPAAVFCEARRTFIRAEADVPLTELEGELTLSIPVSGIEAIYPDEDIDGAADGPFLGHGSLPGEDAGDGQVFSLRCGIGPSAHDDASAWSTFACLPPGEADSDCPAVFIDLSQAHD